MTTFVLDANVLIALTVVEHEHHERAMAWMAGVDSFALCPVTEGALVRFLVRIGETARTAQEVLRVVHALPGLEFWQVTLSYRDADLAHVIGHRQVTDAYLVSLATRRGGRLATLDKAVATSMPESVLLLPQLGSP